MLSHNNAALPLVRGLGRVLDDRLRANEATGSETQIAILNKFDEELNQIVTVNLVAANLAYPASGFIGGKIVEDTGSNMTTLLTVLAGYLVGRMATTITLKSVAGDDFSKLLKDASTTLPEDSAVRAELLRVANDANIKSKSSSLGLLLKLKEISVDGLNPQELYVRNRLLDLVAKERTSERINKFTLFLATLGSAYHGYKRNNDSLAYGIAWAAATRPGLGLALAQGFAKPAP